MPRVRAIVQHLRRHRVPEDMARARFVDPCRFSRIAVPAIAVSVLRFIPLPYFVTNR